MKSHPIAILIHFIGLFTALVGGFSAWGGGALSPDVELGVYRFFGRPDTNSAHVGVYKLNAGLFEPKQYGTLSLKQSDSDECTRLLSNLQSFPLNIMTHVNYLSPGELNSQEQLIRLFAPEQVTFLELTEPVPKSTVANEPDQFPSYKLSLRPDEARPQHIHVRQAGMWIVSGQSMYPWGGEIFKKHHAQSIKEKVEMTWQSALPMSNREVGDPHLVLLTLTAMPWQNNSQLWESGAMTKNKFGWADLDRKKYPLVWEIGRAAQTKPEQMNALFTAAASIIAEEVVVNLQSRYEDAFIFCKALDEDRMRLFRIIGFEPLAGACPKPETCVMVAPLTKLLKRFPVGKQSYRAHEIRNALKKNISLEDALNFLTRIQTYFRADLDFVLKERGYYQQSPVVVHDFSPNYLLLLRAFSEVYGRVSLTDAQKFALRFAEWRGDFGDRHGVNEIIPAEYFLDEFTRRKIVRLTNLDQDLATRDSEYLPTVLLGAREYLFDRYEELHVENGRKLLADVGTQIAVQTFSPLIASQALALGAVPLSPIPGQDGRTLYTVVFDMKLLDRVEKAKPERVRLGRDGLQKGFWFFRSIAANPFKF